MPASSFSANDPATVLATSVTEDGRYRYALFADDVVAVQKPKAEGWETAYIVRDGVCPCTGHQYRGNCQHKPIAAALIAWWRDVGSKATPAQPAP